MTDVGLSETSHGMERALRLRDDIEQVAIETVHVGDYVLLEPEARPASARCVIRKRAKANERTARVVGWLLELTGGQLAWWPRGGLVWAPSPRGSQLMQPAAFPEGAMSGAIA